MKELYVGDGLYISTEDRVEFKLRAPRLHGDDEVFFDEAILERINLYVAAATMKADPKEEQ